MREHHSVLNNEGVYQDEKLPFMLLAVGHGPFAG